MFNALKDFFHKDSGIVTEMIDDAESVQPKNVIKTHTFKLMRIAKAEELDKLHKILGSTNVVFIDIKALRDVEEMKRAAHRAQVIAARFRNKVLSVEKTWLVIVDGKKVDVSDEPEPEAGSAPEGMEPKSE